MTSRYAPGAGRAPAGQAGAVPEGHTIHRLARDHARALGGRAVRVTSPQGRFPDATAVDGAVLEGTDAWGKHLFHDFEGGRHVHVHLGIYGTFTEHRQPAPEPPPTCRMRLEAGEVVLDLVGPTTCELLDDRGRDAVVARLGPDPLRPDADPDRAWEALRRRRTTVGQALLDQRVVAGVGNVFRAEALHVLGIDPRRPAARLTREEFDSLWSTLTAMLRQGVADGRIVTVDPARLGTPRSEITRAEATHVYRRGTCLGCATPVRRWELGGRWAYACPTCQPG
jgi:endonuclease VIII